MAFLVFLAAFMVAQAVNVASQQGFLSIDCGRDAGNYSHSTVKDVHTGIVYVPDGPYVDAGENHVVAAEHRGVSSRFQTVRSFPSGVRNCYTLPTKAGAKYIVRPRFFYGNYDGKNSSTVEFDLYLGASYWLTASLRNTSLGYLYEAVFVAWAGWTPVCLVNTGGGTPFVSVLELRPLGDALYPPVNGRRYMSLYTRHNMGADSLIRYPGDQHDRFWWPNANSSRWTNLSTTWTVRPEHSFSVPLTVLQTAVAAPGNETTLSVLSWQEYKSSSSWFIVFLHFADFQNSQLRQFDAYINDWRMLYSNRPYEPRYLAASWMYSSRYWGSDGKYNLTLVATVTSELPPMLNALEIYSLITRDTPTTYSEDFDAIMAIKLEYGVKKNWTGDPCFPTKYAWDGVQCRNTSGDTMSITSLDLSNSNLRGVISNNFTLLRALENLDLSYNQLTGSIPDSLPSLPSLRVLNLSGNNLSGAIPDSLCKSYAEPRVFRYESDGQTCSKTGPSENRAAIVTISVVVPVLVVAVLILACLIWREKRKPNVSTYDSPRETQPENARGSRNDHRDHLQYKENRQFSYEELENLTDNFKQVIGQGGFGLVYYGCLEDSTEVAVKMCSKSSSYALGEFLSEVQSLTKVHHRNLVSLIGYCWDTEHLALVYEFMSGGNLCDHLRGKNAVFKTLNWGTRVQVVLEAAQGLDYLHNGCSLPIIHRDVKTSNILLGENVHAKIADFGLSKAYLTDTQTHISATAAGTAGYIDPEYYQTGRLTESSDVYSFGVVLLEIATGEPPIVPGQGHIVQRVKQKIATGDIISVADVRLGGSYDASSMSKVVDAAMMCTVDAASQRPTMAAVVAQLRESIALEQAREKDSGVRPSPGSDASTSGPPAG